LQFEQLAIFGPGLIGGSIALAARERNLCRRITIWSRDAAERAAASRSLPGELVTDDPVAALQGSNLAILCTPPLAMPKLGALLAPHLDHGAAVSDVASVKAGVSAPLSAIFAGGADGGGPSRYAGAHPMAGAERSGLAAARANLFEGTVCFLTPDEQTAPDAFEIVRGFWQGLGCRTRKISPSSHDETVALLSHLPHVLAAALVGFAAAQPVESLDCGGPGWRDSTRLAGGSPELWTEILSSNRAPVTNAIEGLIAKLREVCNHFEPGQEANLHEFLAEAKMHRESLALGSRGPKRKDD
jgi:prephenate dehydrogenase